MVVIAAVAEETEPDYLDVDVVDGDSGALPVGGGAARAQKVQNVQPTLFDETVESDQTEAPAQPEAPVEDEELDEAETIAEGDATDQFEAIVDDSGFKRHPDSTTTRRTERPTNTNTSRTHRVWRRRTSPPP